MDNKLSELKAAALAATPGPWGIDRAGNTIVSNQSHPVATVSDAFHRQLASGCAGKDAEFIAAANPAAILALLAKLEAKDMRRQYNEQRPPALAEPDVGDWRIDMSTGTPILMYKECSVIESEQAVYVLSLINAASVLESGKVPNILKSLDND
jgi:hypothetical protein